MRSTTCNAIVTPPPVWEQSIVVSMSVCLSIWELISRTTRPVFGSFSCMLLMAEALSSSGGVVILLCTSGFADNVMFTRIGGIGDTIKACTHSDSMAGHSTDGTLWCILKLTHQGAAPDRGRSLASTIALFYLCLAYWLLRSLFIGNESVPKILISNTTNVFF